MASVIDGHMLRSFAPATGDVVAELPVHTPAQVRTTVQEARTAVLEHPALAAPAAGPAAP
jgi:hypothetical protein